MSAARFHPLWIPPLVLLVLAPLLATEVDPWARMAVALAAAVTCLSLALPAVRASGPLAMQLALLAAPALLLGTWLGADAAGARSRLLDFALCFIAYRAGRDLLGQDGRKWVVAALALVGGLTAARGLYQRWITFPEALQTLAGSDVPEASVVALRIATGRIFSTFLLPSAFAGFLLISLPLSVWLVLRAGIRPLWRRLALASAALQAVALFLTFSHGAFLSLVLALAVVAALAAGTAVRRAILVAAGATMVLLVAVVLVRGEGLTGPSSPVAQRVGNWQVATAQIADHPVAGVGWGGYGAAYTRYQKPGMNQSRYVHNSYLQLLAEGGLLTLPLLLVFAVWLVRRLRVLAPDEHLLGLALVAVLVHNALDFTLLLPGIAVPFFFVLACLAPRTQPAAVAAGWSSAGRAFAVLLALALAGLTVAETMARRGFAQAQVHRLEGRSAAAGAAVRSAVRWDPWNSTYHDFLAHWLLDQQDGDDPAVLEEASAAARQAIRLSPRRPRHHTTLERICLARGDGGCAFREASLAAALFPMSEEYQQRLQRYLPSGGAP